VPNGDETARLLGGLDVFSALAPRELEQVAHVAVPRSYERGEVIFREGDSGDSCYVVREGSVSVAREHHVAGEVAAARTITLAELRPGEMFGELAMFDNETRSATVEALEPTTVVALLAGDVQRLLRQHPDIAVKMMGALSARLRRANERLMEQSFRTVPGRVASGLLAQVVARQAHGAPEADVLIEATQAEIAQLAGTSRESASRFLATLEREGVVSLGRGKVTVHEPARLRDFIH
jgi:CRP/FNR family cyclic AMP-dependent transcriptional regulator